MEETLHTAARRALRNFRICEGKGLIDIQLQQAMATLDLQVEKENRRLKAEAEAKEARDVDAR